MKPIFRSPGNMLLALGALLFLLVTVMQFTTQQRAITTQQKLAAQVQENQARLYAANREAANFRESHAKEAASADLLRQQVALDAESVRLKTVEDGLLANLLAASRSAQSIKPLLFLGPSILLLVFFIAGRTIGVRRKEAA